MGTIEKRERIGTKTGNKPNDVQRTKRQVTSSGGQHRDSIGNL